MKNHEKSMKNHEKSWEKIGHRRFQSGDTSKMLGGLSPWAVGLREISSAGRALLAGRGPFGKDLGKINEKSEKFEKM